MSFDFDYSKEKNELLKESRGVGFDDVLEAFEKNNQLDGM